MKLTGTQLALLRWLVHIEGVCIPWRDKVAHPWWGQPAKQRQSQRQRAEAAYKMPAVSALHLVASGHIEAIGGHLRITELGRKELQP